MGERNLELFDLLMTFRNRVLLIIQSGWQAFQKQLKEWKRRVYAILKGAIPIKLPLGLHFPFRSHWEVPPKSE